ncbi:hypothetical protein FRB99_006159 [Tulasnella sp. 403]|nr:hypothetical protein FRB99_006159 [Tulasnella sp. 403]
MFRWTSLVFLALFAALYAGEDTEPTPRIERTANVIVHTTDPRVTLSPRFSCSTIFGCGAYDPWELMAYHGPDGRLHSFHRTKSAGNQPHSENVRQLTFEFVGTAVYLYAPPQSPLEDFPLGLQEVCLDGTCKNIDVSTIYDDSDPGMPVLLWGEQDLPPHHHRLQIRLLDDHTGWPFPHVDVMAIQYIRYTSVGPPLPDPYKPPIGADLANVTLEDTNYAMTYRPLFSFYNSKPYKPWDTFMSRPTYGPADTFRHTSNWGNARSGSQMRQVTFSFQGAALYIYGAPPETLKTITNGRYLHAHQDICVNDQCYPIDAHQAYLNVDKQDESHPVLVWAYDRFDPTVISTVHLRLLDSQSPDGLEGTQMTFSKAVYSEVQRAPPWKVPVPGAEYGTFRVPHEWLTYSPWGWGWWSNNPWYVDHGCRVAWNMMETEDEPKWSFTFTGYGVKVYGPPKYSFLGVTHASQKVCVDGRCHYIDVEHAYLSVLPGEANRPVLLWSTFGLESNMKHTISVQLVQRPDDSRRTMMAVSHLEYLTVEYPRPKPQLPPTPTSPPGTPIPTKDAGPLIDPKVLEVLGLVVLLVFGLFILVSVVTFAIVLVVDPMGQPRPTPVLPTPTIPVPVPAPRPRFPPPPPKPQSETDSLLDNPPPYEEFTDGPQSSIPPPYSPSRHAPSGSSAGPSRERTRVTLTRNGESPEQRTSPAMPSTRRSRYGTFAGPSGNGGGGNSPRR